jgi:general secretion pathway protein F
LFRLAEFLEKQLALKHKATNAIYRHHAAVGTWCRFSCDVRRAEDHGGVCLQAGVAVADRGVDGGSRFCSDYWMVLLGMILVGLWSVRRVKKTRPVS